GYTIRGVQRILREQGQKFVQNVWQPGAPQPTPLAGDSAPDDGADELDRQWEQQEHTGDKNPSPAAVAAAVVSAVPPEHLRKLQAVLDDLTECRRLLDAALNQRS